MGRATQNLYEPPQRDHGTCGLVAGYKSGWLMFENRSFGETASDTLLTGESIESAAYRKYENPVCNTRN